MDLMLRVLKTQLFEWERALSHPLYLLCTKLLKHAYEYSNKRNNRNSSKYSAVFSPGFKFTGLTKWLDVNLSVVFQSVTYTYIRSDRKIYFNNDVYHIIYKSSNRNKVRDKFGITYFEKLITMQI